jgi:hypothetical protein
LADEPERAIAVLVWIWARLPDVIGEAVDLNDHERVWAIVSRVEQVEFGATPEPSPSSEPLEPPAPADPTSGSAPISEHS